MSTKFLDLNHPNAENRLLSLFVSIFVVIHIVLIFFNLNVLFSLYKPQEFEIEAELVDSFGMKESKEDTIKLERSVKAEELKIQKETLPQLTKNFNLTEDSHPEEDALEALEKIKKTEENIEREKSKALIELSKEEAIRRLLKEKAMRELKIDTQNQSKANENQTTTKSQTQDLSLGTSDVSQYNSILKTWVQKFYAVPQSYASDYKQKLAIVEIILNQDGTLQKASLVESSGNYAFDQLALKTIYQASPYPVPPKEYVSQPLRYRFNASKKN